MRLSRANIPLASEDRTHSQAIYTSPHNNLAPHFLPGFINLQHFRHSRWRNPVRLSKMGIARTREGTVRPRVISCVWPNRRPHRGPALAWSDPYAREAAVDDNPVTLDMRPTDLSAETGVEGASRRDRTSTLTLHSSRKADARLLRKGGRRPPPGTISACAADRRYRSLRGRPSPACSHKDPLFQNRPGESNNSTG